MKQLPGDLENLMKDVIIYLPVGRTGIDIFNLWLFF